MWILEYTFEEEGMFHNFTSKKHIIKKWNKKPDLIEVLSTIYKNNKKDYEEIVSDETKFKNLFQGKDARVNYGYSYLKLFYREIKNYNEEEME